jgi:cytoskeleton protein RodZ
MSEVFQADFGARLKAARMAKNLAVADVAAKLKLTSRQVEALEEENLRHLPSEIFVRGFVRNYARLVDIDPDSLIAPVNVQAEVSETITAPSAGLNVGSNGLRRWVVYPMIGGVIFLVLVAGLYHWLRQGEDTLIAPPPETAAQVLPPAAVAPVAPPVPLVTPAPAAPDGAGSVMTPLNLPGVSQPPAPVAPAPVSAAPSAAVPAPVSSPVPVSAAPAKPAAPAAIAASPKPDVNVKPGVHSMRFEPTQDAWIQVVDAKGSRFSKLVRAGSAESFSGEPPFRLVVGEAALVKLTYNGHGIDLTPFIGQKVARLTLE